MSLMDIRFSKDELPPIPLVKVATFDIFADPNNFGIANKDRARDIIKTHILFMIGHEKMRWICENSPDNFYTVLSYDYYKLTFKLSLVAVPENAIMFLLRFGNVSTNVVLHA